MWCPGWGSGTEKGHQGKTKEIRIKSVLGNGNVPMLVHWVCDKCTMVMCNVNKGETLYTIFATFFVNLKLF